MLINDIQDEIIEEFSSFVRFCLLQEMDPIHFHNQ